MGIKSDVKNSNDVKTISSSVVQDEKNNHADADKALEIQDEIQEKAQFKHADGGMRAWLVCAATVWAFGINLAFEYNYTLIHNEFTIVYNETKDNVVYAAWIGSLTVGIEFLFFLPSSILVDLFGARIVSFCGSLLATVGLICSGFVKSIYIYFVTYSLIVGAGTAFFTEATFAILPHYFDKKIGIAYGVMNLGSSVIVIVNAVLSSKMFEAIGLSNNFYVLAALTFPTVLLSLLYKPQLPSESGGLTKHNFVAKVKESFGTRVLKKPKFLLWASSCLIGFFGATIPILTIDHHSEHLFKDESPEIINIVYAAVTGIASMVCGKILDMIKIHRIYFHAICFFILGVSQIALAYVPNFGSLVGVYAVYAIGNGIYYCCLMPIACEVAEDPALANQAIGYFHAFITLPAIIGPTVAGVIFEKYHGYDYAYFMGGGMCILCAIIQCFYPSGVLRKAKRQVLRKLGFKKEAINEKKPPIEDQIYRF